MTVLAGGVGGARMARALRSIVAPGNLTIVVNVGDNTRRYGVHIAADPDTVLYTLSDRIGPHGWGRADDTLHVMTELSELGVDTTFTLGDKDLALCAWRAARLDSGEPLSAITRDVAERFGLTDIALIPATDDRLETRIETDLGEILDFQTYFVDRGHRDEVAAVFYEGADEATAAPGVIEAVESADIVVIAPSNPPLSIHPILAIPEIAGAIESHERVIAVSPLFGGKPLKGPADKVMRGVGYSEGTRGILECYEGLIDTLWVDDGDRDDVHLGEEFGIEVRTADTRLDDANGPTFARRVIDG